MGRFIYVFDKETADALIEQGLTLIKSNNRIYVFKNDPSINQKFSGKDFIFSNTLTFQFGG